MPPAGRGRGRGQGKSPARGRSTRTRVAKAAAAAEVENAEPEQEPQPDVEGAQEVEESSVTETEEPVAEEPAAEQQDTSMAAEEGAEDDGAMEKAEGEDETVDDDQMEGDEEVIDEYIAEGEEQAEGDAEESGHQEEAGPEDAEVDNQADAPEADQMDAEEAEQMDAEEAEQMDGDEGDQADGEEGDQVEAEGDFYEEAEDGDYNGEAEEGMEADEAEGAHDDEAQDGGEDAPEQGETADEEGKSADQSEDYCVVDEVSGDTEEKVQGETGESKSAKKPAKKVPANKAKAAGKEGDEKDKESKKEEKEEKKKAGPRLRATRGFIPTKSLLSKEVRKTIDSRHLLLAPITMEDFLKEETQKAIAAAKYVVFKLGKKDAEPGKGFLELKFNTEEAAEEALKALQENFKDAETLNLGNKIKILQETRNLHTKFFAGALMDFPFANTLTLFNLPRKLDKSELQEIFGESVRIHIPKSDDKTNKCFGFVELNSPKEVKEWVTKETLTVKDNVIKLMPVVDTPTLKNFMPKLQKLQLNVRLQGPLPSGLKQYYNDLTEMILFFLNWSEPSDLNSMDKSTLNRYHSQLLNKLRVSGILEEKAKNPTANTQSNTQQGRKSRPGKKPTGKDGKPVQGNKPPGNKPAGNRPQGQGSPRTPNQGANQGQRMNRNQGPGRQQGGNRPGGNRQQGPMGKRNNQNRGNRPQAGRSPDGNRQGFRDRTASGTRFGGQYSNAGQKRSQQTGRYNDQQYNAKRPRRDSGGRGSFYDDMARDNRRRSTGGMGMDTGMGSSLSALNEMTGLPNMNRMQTMGVMPAMGMPQQLMAIPQQMGSMDSGMYMGGAADRGGSYRGQQARLSQDVMGGYSGDQMQRGREDLGYGARGMARDQRDFSQSATASIEPQKTENAINLLLGLSKMLKGQGQSRDTPRDYDFQGGGY